MGRKATKAILSEADMGETDQDQAKVYIWIDAPNILESLELWEVYLKMLQAWPDNASGKDLSIRDAEDVIARKRRGEIVDLAAEFELARKELARSE